MTAGLTPRRLLAAGLAAVVALAAGPSMGQQLDKRERERLLRVGDEAMSSARELLGRNDVKEAKERLAEAEKAYQGILTREPMNKEAAVGMSQVLYLTSRYDKGIELMRPLVDAHPDDNELTHQLALHLYRHGMRDEAVKLFEKVATDDERFDAMWLLSTHYYRTADWAKGLPHIERYVKVRKDDDKALGLLGTYYLKLERFPDAIKTFDRFLEAYPNNTAIRINRANALFRSEKYDAAGADYERLLEKYPKRARLLYNLSAVRIKQQRCDDAVELLDRFLALKKGNATALYFKADCQMKLGRYADARETFMEAGQAATSNPWVYYGLSMIAWKEGNLPEALEQAKKAAELGPDEWEIAGWVGTLLRKSGDAKEALAWHDRALENKADAPALHVERGRDLWALERLDDAEPAFAKALELAPKDQDAQLGLATVRTAQAVKSRRAGKPELARQKLVSALDVMPGYDPARVNLALIELAGGKVAEASKAIGKVKGGGPDLEAVRGMVALLEGRTDDARRAIDAALKGKTTLEAMAWTASGHIAAAEGAWDKAVDGFDKAHAIEPSDTLRRARVHANLNLGLERLARGEAGAARAALAKADEDSRLLSDGGDRVRLDFALAVSGVMARPGNDRASGDLAGVIAKRLRGRRWTELKDLGYATLGWSLLQKGDAKGALKQLRRVRGDLGGATAKLRAAAQDVLARKAFESKRYGKAAKLWKEIADPTPAVRHNIAAAEFASGSGGAAKVWAGAGMPAEALYNRAIAADREANYKEAWELLRQYVRKGQTNLKRARQRLKAKQQVFGWGREG